MLYSYGHFVFETDMGSNIQPRWDSFTFCAPWGVIIVCISILHRSAYLLPFIWQEMQTDSFLPVPTISFSLSSASPAHSPKEEYVITQSTDTPKMEAVHDQPEDQGEPRDHKAEMTEKKSLAGWSAAYQLL